MSPSPKTPDEKKLPEDETSSNDELAHPPFHVQNEYIASTDESTTNSDDENNNNNNNSNQQYENFNGYCLLPQDSDFNHQENEDEDEEFLRFATLRAESSIEENKPSSSTNPPIHPIESIWSTTLESESFPVDDDKANYIKNLMSKIELPQSSIPTWAQYCSEQDWQEKLRERITCRQTTFFSKEKN
jgi:hypothetical protein